MSESSTPRPFEVSDYKPDQACPVEGFILCTTIVLLSAVGLGWLGSRIGEWLHMPVVLPLLVALALGFIGWGGVHLGKIRNDVAAGLCGLAGAVVLIGVWHFNDLARYRESVAGRLSVPLRKMLLADLFSIELDGKLAQVAAGNGAIAGNQGEFAEKIRNVFEKLKDVKNQPEVDMIIPRLGDRWTTIRQRVASEAVAKKLKVSSMLTPDSELSQFAEAEITNAVGEWASTLGMWEYLNLTTERGVPFRFKVRFTISGGWLWAAWVVESLLSVAIVAGMMGHFAESKPFCRNCNRWKVEHSKTTLFVPTEAAVEELRAGDLVRFAALRATEGNAAHHLHVVACPACAEMGGIEIRLVHLTAMKKGEENGNEVAHLSYPGAALAYFDALRTSEPNPEPNPEVAPE